LGLSECRGVPLLQNREGQEAGFEICLKEQDCQVSILSIPGQGQNFCLCLRKSLSVDFSALASHRGG